MVSDYDEAQLVRLMEQAENENREVSGDEGGSEDDSGDEDNFDATAAV